MTQLRRMLTPLDVASIGFLSTLIALCLLFAGRIESWFAIVLTDLAVIGAIVGLAWFAEKRPSTLLIGIHRWYSYPIVLFVFKQLYLMVRPIHPVDYDQLFISIDRWLFGVDPTVWMYQFAHPILTEILQISYFSYYILFIVLGVEVYRRYPIHAFDRAAFLIVYGFYLSYIGYFLLPAVGPRFTLHDFAAINTELPGLVLTETLRDIINAGESIPKGAPNAVDLVQRDVFPSGHTQMTLITVFLAFQYRIQSRFVIAALASLLLIGTVYLRYHYVIDLVGGVLFFLFTIWSGDRFRAAWSGSHPPSPDRDA